MTAGGELLRGVMEANAVYSNPALYCIPLPASTGAAGATGTFRSFLQLHKELWFMATAIIPTATDIVADFGFERISSPEFVRLFDPVTQDDYAQLPLDMQATMYGDSTLNNPYTLPEYLLFAPAQLIGVEITGPNQFPNTEFKFLTLLGIEYGMRDH